MLLLWVLLQEYTVKVRRTIPDEPASKSYPALIVSVGSGVSIIKVRGRARMSVFFWRSMVLHGLSLFSTTAVSVHNRLTLV